MVLRIKNPSKAEINTIFILSKGRPQCTTAKTLEGLGYKGEWWILCGNNDDRLEEYKRNWGDKVLVFDWYKKVLECDLMDNFKGRLSGVTPARNVAKDIAKGMGKKRFWEFDDDFLGFKRTNLSKNKNEKIVNGDELEELLYQASLFGYRARATNIGFSFSFIECNPINYDKFNFRVYGTHNLSTDESIFEPYTGRTNEDINNPIDLARKGKYSFQFRFMQVLTRASRKESGGLTELYKQDGSIKRAAYSIMRCPSCCRLVFDKYGWHDHINYKDLVPKFIDERYKKVE